MKKFLISVLILSMLAGAGFAIYYRVIPKIQEEQKAEEVRQAIAAYYREKCEAFAEENALLGEVDAVFLGDSLFDGYDTASAFPTLTVANRGIGGDTAAGLLARMDVSAYALKPKAAVILIGGNDLDGMLDSYGAILEGMREHLPDCKLILASIPCLGGEWAKNNEKVTYANAVVQAYAEKYGCIYVDLYTPFCNPETGRQYDGYTGDGAHPTEKTYREIFTPRISSALRDCGVLQDG